MYFAKSQNLGSQVNPRFQSALLKLHVQSNEHTLSDSWVLGCLRATRAKAS